MSKGEVLKKQIQYYAYCIGALLFLKFGKTIGNNGIVYLAIGLETMALLMAVLGQGVSDVYSKMLRSRRKRGLFHDAMAIKRRVKFLQITLGILIVLLSFVFADTIAIKLFHTEKASLIIRILTPVLLLRAINSILSGYLQSIGKYLSLSILSVLRIILFSFLGGVFANNRLEYGAKVAALLKSDDYIGLYGAIGIAIGILITEVILVIALFILYFLNDYLYDKKNRDRNLHKTESVKETISNYVYLNNHRFWFDLFKRVMIMVPFVIIINNISAAGVFYGKFLPLCSIPVLLIGARYFLLYSRLSNLNRNKETRMTREHIQTGIQYTWSVSLLFVALFAVLAPQISDAFFTKDLLMKEMLQYGSVLILLVTMFAYLFMVNIAHNRKLECFVVMVITVVLHIIINRSMYNKLQKPEAVLYATCISLAIGVFLLGFFTIFMYGLRLEYIYVFLLPLICIGVAGVVVLLMAKYMSPHIGSTLCSILGFILGTVLYVAGLSLCRVFSDLEIDRIYGPLGKKLFSFIFK